MLARAHYVIILHEACQNPLTGDGRTTLAKETDHRQAMQPNGPNPLTWTKSSVNKWDTPRETQNTKKHQLLLGSQAPEKISRPPEQISQPPEQIKFPGAKLGELDQIHSHGQNPLHASGTSPEKPNIP